MTIVYKKFQARKVQTSVKDNNGFGIQASYVCWRNTSSNLTIWNPNTYKYIKNNILHHLPVPQQAPRTQSENVLWQPLQNK